MNLRNSKFLLLLVFTMYAQIDVAAQTKLKWFGQAAFSITTPKVKALVLLVRHQTQLLLLPNSND